MKKKHTSTQENITQGNPSKSCTVGTNIESKVLCTYEMHPKDLFIIYVRTIQFMKTRLKGIDDSTSVHISQKEIEDRFFIYPQHERKVELKKLVDEGMLKITQEISPKTGHKMYMYNALRSGAIDLYMLKPKHKKLDPLYKVMRDHLQRVTLAPGSPSTIYFDVFLNFRQDLPELFYTVDDFSGRIHTPITNFHRTHRPNVRIDGCKTIGLDVATMQPLLLGKILIEKIGVNEYSNWIYSGKDIYIMLQTIAGLKTRDEAKKHFFELLFAPPSERLSRLFGANDWIKWTNTYKRLELSQNPHNKQKRYSNLAWLLQSTEVSIMRKVWQKLYEADIVFLSVHDEVIIKEKDQQQAEIIFNEVLSKEFKYHKLLVKGVDSILLYFQKLNINSFGNEIMVDGVPLQSCIKLWRQESVNGNKEAYFKLKALQIELFKI